MDQSVTSKRAAAQRQPDGIAFLDSAKSWDTTGAFLRHLKGPRPI